MTKKRVYIVSGFMRSGTSMMMQALEAGGLNAVYDKRRNELNEKFGDEHYQINGDGFYELMSEDYQHPEFPDNHEGKLVKALYGIMPMLKPSDTMKYIVFMRRPFEEIAKSYIAAFGRLSPQIIPEITSYLDRVQDILRQRRDVVIEVVDYHDTLNNPLVVFEKLKKCGWCINPKKAAAIIDPSKRRHAA